MFKLLTVLLAALSVLSCSKPDPIHVGMHPWIGYQPIKIAQQKNLLPDNITLIENKTALDTKQQFIDGTIDAGYLTLDEVLQLIDQGLDLKVVLITNISSGADKVISRTAAETPESLLGKTIGYEKGAVGELVLYSFLQKMGLELNQIKTRIIGADQHVEAWQKDQLDLLISYDPNATKIVSQHGGHEVFSSRQMPDMIIDVLVVRQELIDTQLAQIKELTKAHFAGLDLIKHSFQETSYLIADNLGIKQEETIQTMGELTLPSKENNLHVLGNGFFERTQAIANVLLQAGMIKSAPEQPIHTDRCI